MFTVLWEAMITEMRATYLDLHARATFTKDGENVRDTRGIVADWLKPKPSPQEQRETTAARSSSKLAAAFRDGFIEVG